MQTTKGHLLFLRVQYEQFSPDKQTHYSTREHGMYVTMVTLPKYIHTHTHTHTHTPCPGGSSQVPGDLTRQAFSSLITSDPR